jgi:hypothetical protein
MQDARVKPAGSVFTLHQERFSGRTTRNVRA